MTLQTLKARMTKLERRHPDLTPGLHRVTDDELDGLIDVLRRLEAGEPVDEARLEWAACVLHREDML
jgi:hypothetical protein